MFISLCLARCGLDAPDRCRETKKGQLATRSESQETFRSIAGGEAGRRPRREGEEVSWRLVAPSEDSATNQEAQVPPEPKQLEMYLTLEARDLRGERSKPINGVGYRTPMVGGGG